MSVSAFSMEYIWLNLVVTFSYGWPPLLPSVRHPSQTAFISANCEPIFIQDFFKWRISKWQSLEDFKEKAPESSVVALQLCHQFQSLEMFGQQINIDCSTTKTTTTTVAEKTTDNDINNRKQTSNKNDKSYIHD